jgi:hypothetical protein
MEKIINILPITLKRRKIHKVHNHLQGIKSFRK